MHNKSERSVLRPSSAARRMACPGSRKMESLYPVKPSPAALEGIAAHWAAMKALNQEPVVLGDVAPNGEIITAEMMEGAALYFDCVQRNVIKDSIPDLFLTEVPLTMSEVHPAAWGTADCVVFGNGLGLHIFDYKYGHRFVNAVENLQLVYYALGACETFKLKPQKITLWIVQPRYFGSEGKIRKWELNQDTLDVFKSRLKACEELAMGDNPPVSPSKECLFCAARYACPALQNAVLSFMDFSGESVPDDLTPSQVGKELKLLRAVNELLKARMTGLETLAENLISSGLRVPAFTLQSGRGSLRWKKSIEEIKALAALYNIEITKPLELITPNQAVKKGLPEYLLKEFTSYIPGSLRLVEDKK